MGPQATPPPEKRRIPRKHPRVRLLTQVESQTSGASSLGRTKNISQGGLLVYSRETFDASTKVIVRFNLSPGHLIEAPGVVMHSLPQVSMGIKFLQLKDDDRKAIEEFVWQTGEESNSHQSSKPS
jgi:c-di-GMP-binding flagellar brake protein YcgR